jgi:glycyl-tRNA synthetase
MNLNYILIWNSNQIIEKILKTHFQKTKNFIKFIMSKIKKISTIEDHNKALEELNVVKNQANTMKNKINELKEKKEDHSTLSNELKVLSKKLETLNQNFIDTDPDKLHINRNDFEKLMIRRFFYNISYEIYQGVSGLYDYGPSCCAIQTNVLTTWRKHFINHENMLEMDLTCLTPQIVFKVSGLFSCYF